MFFFFLIILQIKIIKTIKNFEEHKNNITVAIFKNKNGAEF